MNNTEGLKQLWVYMHVNEEEKLIISITPYNSNILHYKIIQHAKIFNRAIRANPFISLSIATVSYSDWDLT